MFDAIKRLFADAAERDPFEDDALTPELACATLLVQAALTDGVYADVEQSAILDILKTGFDLAPDAALSLLNEAEARAETASDHHRFTKIVKHLPKDRRMRFMTQLWQVALADGDKEAREDALLRRMAPLLALSDRERAEARQAAEAARR